MAINFVKGIELTFNIYFFPIILNMQQSTFSVASYNLIAVIVV